MNTLEKLHKGVLEINKSWLEAFISVYNTQSVSKTAEILFLTQPTVTNRIQSFEKEVGESLFHRSQRKMIPTEAGRTFYPFALQILENWKKGNEAIHHLNDTVQGELRIGLFYSGVNLFSDYFLRFAEKFPHIKLIVKTGHSEELNELVLNHIIDIGIKRSIFHASIQSISVVEDKFVLTVYKDHPLAKKKLIEPDEIKGENFILQYSGSNDKDVISRFFETEGIVPNVVFETDNMEICKQNVLAKRGIAFFPKSLIKNELRNGSLIEVKFRKEYPIFTRNIDLVWLKKSNHYLLSVFVDFLKAELEAKIC